MQLVSPAVPRVAYKLYIWHVAVELYFASLPAALDEAALVAAHVERPSCLHNVVAAEDPLQVKTWIVECFPDSKVIRLENPVKCAILAAVHIASYSPDFDAACLEVDALEVVLELGHCQVAAGVEKMPVVRSTRGLPLR